MSSKYSQGQRVYCAAEAQYGLLTSGPRLLPSDLRVGLNPPVDPKAIPSYDVRFDNGATGTLPETDFTTALAHRGGKASAWVEKHKAILMLVLAVASAALAAAKLLSP
jgi:hypothetical protein